MHYFSNQNIEGFGPAFYGINMITHRAGSDKIKTFFRIPAGEVPTSTVHAMCFLWQNNNRSGSR
jgi:hypothetical protein